MSIQPISDIILDVANAADPAKVAAVKQKLAEASGGDFAALLLGGAGAGAPQTASAKWSEQARSQFFSSPTGPRVVDKGASEVEAKRGLETMITKMMIETMLPEEGESTFGKGTAGGIWRSMLADRLATELSRGKGLGILRDIKLPKGDA